MLSYHHKWRWFLLSSMDSKFTNDADEWSFIAMEYAHLFYYRLPVPRRTQFSSSSHRNSNPAWNFPSPLVLMLLLIYKALTYSVRIQFFINFCNHLIFKNKEWSFDPYDNYCLSTNYSSVQKKNYGSAVPYNPCFSVDVFKPKVWLQVDLRVIQKNPPSNCPMGFLTVL